MVEKVNGSGVKALKDSNGRCKGNGTRKSTRRVTPKTPWTPTKKSCGKKRDPGKTQKAKPVSFKLATDSQVATESRDDSLFSLDDLPLFNESDIEKDVPDSLETLFESAKAASVINLEQGTLAAENGLFANISMDDSFCSCEDLEAFKGLYFGESSA